MVSRGEDVIFIAANKLHVVNCAVPELNDNRRFIVVPKLNYALFAERFDVMPVDWKAYPLAGVFDVNKKTVAPQAQGRFYVNCLVTQAKRPPGKIDRPSAREGR